MPDDPVKDAAATAKKEESQQRQATFQLSMDDEEALLLQGDLAKLSNAGRKAYYRKRCDDLELDYLSRPFDYLVVNNPIRGLPSRVVLYANKNCFEQLRVKRNASSEIVKDVVESGVFRAYARAKCPIMIDCKIADYRFYDDIGAIPVSGLGGAELSNAIMKGVTKAHRRAMLGLCGLGMLDETEVETVPNATPISEEELDKLSGKFSRGTQHLNLNESGPPSAGQRLITTSATQMPETTSTTTP